jgi:predicted esterase
VTGHHHVAATERHIRTPRTARCYVLGDAGSGTRELWLVCHGYAQLARFFVRPFAAIADETRVIVAPEALNRYYFESAPGVHAARARVAATWMTREDRDHEIADYVEYLDNVVADVLRDVGPDVAITALGFSQGAATASRWAACTGTRLRQVVLWGSGLPPELEPRPDLFRGAPLVLAAGTSDVQVPAARIEAEQRRCSGAGMDCRLHRHDGGHRIDAAALAGLLPALRGRAAGL